MERPFAGATLTLVLRHACSDSAERIAACESAIIQSRELSERRFGVGLMERDEIRRALRTYLGRAQDVDFFRLIWSIHALQSNRIEQARPHIRFPARAATSDINDRFAVYKWDLETFVTCLLLGRKTPPSKKRPPLSCKNFADIIDAVNMLRSLEDAESSLHIDETNIMLELHRIAQRQFPWQRGFVKPQNAYRFLYVYGQGKCAEHFAAKHGIRITDFVLCAFAFFWLTYNNPFPLTPFSDVLNPAMIEAALKVMALSPEGARLKAREMREKAVEKNGGKELSRTIYQPSVLREFPIVRVGRNLIAPLPDLIMYRATSGLFFDIVGNGQDLINDANQRFEEYARLLIKSHLPRFEVLEAQTYRSNKSEAQTPDVLVKDDGKIVAVFECKATKLSFQAQYAESPMESARTAYDQMTKGIFQLWKFFSHARQGIFSEHKVSDSACAVLLTMDTWFAMAGDHQKAAVEDAKKRAKADPGIIDADMRPVVFCSADDLEDVIGWATEDTFLKLFEVATKPKYEGWSVIAIQRDEGLKAAEWKKFALNLGDLIPGM